MDKRLRMIYRRTGIFVLLAMLILVFLVLFIAQRQRTFSRKYSFYTIFDDAIGLEKNNQVIFKGTEIGRIRNFSFNEQRNVEVRFFVYREYRDLILENSAITKNVNPLGGRASLDFLMGPPGEPLVEENSLIPSLDMEAGKRLLADRKVRVRTDQLSTIISNLGHFAENLNLDNNLDQGSFFRMMYHLASVSENLNTSLINFNKIAASLQKDNLEAEGALFRLTVNLANLTEDFRISNSLLAQNLMNLNTLIVNYSNPENLIVKMLDPTEGNIVTPLNETLNKLNQNLEDINKLINYFHYQTPEVSLLISETNKTLYELQKTLQGLNNNPLLRGGIRREELPSSGERIRLMEGEQ